MIFFLETSHFCASCLSRDWGNPQNFFSFRSYLYFKIDCFFLLQYFFGWYFVLVKNYSHASSIYSLETDTGYLQQPLFLDFWSEYDLSRVCLGTAPVLQEVNCGLLTPLCQIFLLFLKIPAPVTVDTLPRGMFLVLDRYSDLSSSALSNSKSDQVSWNSTPTFILWKKICQYNVYIRLWTQSRKG